MRLRWWRTSVLVGVILALGPASLAWADAVPASPVVSAKAAILLDANTGAILFEKQAFRQMDPASVTKIMTAIVVIQSGQLAREVRISSRAAYVEGSKLHVRPGQRYSMLDLLRGLLLRSGNDAAIALAEADAGSVDQFAAKMNAEAQRLGAFNTRFQNPHGLTRSGHYTDAYDLALIARAALRLPQFRQIVASRELDIVEMESQSARTIRTTNRLLYEFPGADGIKTGTTNAAGQCVVASASRGGRRLIAVVLKSNNRWQDATRLLTFGFSAWEDRTLYRQGQTVADVSVLGGREASVPIVALSSATVSMPKGARITVVERFPRRLKAPVNKRPIGYVYLMVEDEQPIRIGVEPETAVAPQNPIHRFWYHLWNPGGFLWSGHSRD